MTTPPQNPATIGQPLIPSTADAATGQAPAPQQQQQQPPQGYFTAADLERVRQEEKDKLYGRLTAAEQQAKQAAEQAAQLAEWRQQQEAEAQRLADEQAAAQRAKDEEELSAKDLLARQRTEWEQQLHEMQSGLQKQLEEERTAREQSEALRVKEREFSELREYIQQVVAANRDKIAPQLLDWVAGNTTEEVDAAVQRAISTTEALATDFQNTMQQQGLVPQQPGVVPQQPQVPAPVPSAAGPANSDPASQFQTLTAEQIQNMDMATYAKYRQSLGTAGAGQNNRGLFG